MLDLKDLISRREYYLKEFYRRGAIDSYKSFLRDYDLIKEDFSVSVLEILSRSTPVNSIKEVHETEEENILFRFLYNYLLLPNITSKDVPTSNGSNEYCNKIIKEHIVSRDISWLLSYWEFLEEFKLFSGVINKEIWHVALPYFFWILSKINDALLFYMKWMSEKAWYEWISVPSLISSKAMFNTWAFPKHIDWAFHIKWLDLVLSPTSEIQLTNLIQYLWLLWEDLNKKVYRFSSHSRCFRMENKIPDIMWNFYEFEKVELFTFCDKDIVEQEYNKMLQTVENILIELWLSYRLVLLWDNDMWLASQITHDFEVFYPVSKKWVEVSSCSIHWDFASKRMDVKINWRYYNTLHWSALAIPRIIWCIVEQCQDKWEDIIIPKSLKKYII